MENHTVDSRRTFLKATAFAGTTLAGSASIGHAIPVQEERKLTASGNPKIKIAGYKYDRIEAIIDGRVQVEGCDVQFQPSSIGQMNRHVFDGPQIRDVTEIGLMPFILACANEEFSDYTLIPVFPLRVFRHKSIFIRTDRGISKPQDLKGRRVATPGYSSTSLTWIRGIMQHEYGIKPEDIEWIVSSKDSSAKSTGGASRFENILPQGISIHTGPTGKDESDLLVDGDVDALFHAAEPRAYQQGHPKVARLFADARKTERAYFAKTGIFPIMHAIAIRKDSIRSHPWLPKAVFAAYSQAKQLAYESIRQTAWYKMSLPWVGQEAEETRKLMGDNYWPYAVDPNRKALNALVQYAYEQGLAKRKVEIDELFHRSTLELKEARS